MSSEEFWEHVNELGGGPAVFIGLLIFIGVIGTIAYIVARAILF